MSQYVLSSAAEAERLRIPSEVWRADVEAMLDEIGVSEGWHCLDVGCGAVGILEPLSRRVGPRGRVVGIDIDPPLLEEARAFVREAGLSNVEILEADARDTKLPRQSFDLVHARFLLVFGQHGAILREMRALVRPGGVLAAEETDHASWRFHPPREAWARALEIIEAWFASIGGDPNLGTRLPALLRGQGLEGVRVRAAVRALQDAHPYMRMPLTALGRMRERVWRRGWPPPTSSTGSRASWSR